MRLINQHIILIIFLIVIPTMSLWCQSTDQQTYAEKLGWKKGEKVIIFHVDDAGMSFDSNMGTIDAIENGVATSVSVMMPCPWVPGMVRYLKEHPDVDAGLHLTLTSEWDDYRWEPLTGTTAKGLIDGEGAFWKSVEDVVGNASADEVEAEIRAQLARARKMGFEPTHLDSHMGTLMATPEYLERYVKVGIEEQIPILFPAGHNSMLIQYLKEEQKAALQQKGEWKEGQSISVSAEGKKVAELGKKLWESGLPVIDDLHHWSYGWELPENKEPTDQNLQDFKTAKYLELLKDAKPGITMVLMHCTSPTEVFPHISDSGDIRKADLLAMKDPKLKQFIADQGIILTTWKELKSRRDQLSNNR